MTYIKEERLLNEFKQLAAFDSESYYEKDISDYLFKKLTDLGLELSIDDAGHKLNENEKATGNIYGFLKGNKEGQPLLFSAHMDTVAPGRGKKVICHQDGRVTSDGSTVLGSDDATGIAAILEMLTVIKEEKLEHPDIEVIFFVAEELYCKGSSLFDFSKVRAKTAYVLDLDGPIGTIANAAPSIVQFQIKIHGKSAHAGFEPEKGISAIQVAAQAINNLQLGRIDSGTTANVGIISGGSGRNVVPELVELQGEVRATVNERALEIIDKIKKEFEKAGEQFGARVEFGWEEMIKAYRVPEDSFAIKNYQRALEELGLGPANIIQTFGGSDNNNFNKYGIEGIVISSAMNKVHTVNEYFYLEDLVKSAEILVKLISQ